MPAGEEFECISLPIQLEKEVVEGVERVGMRVGGGLDQDAAASPYPDNGVYVTAVSPGGPAEKAGLRPHDKILQVNGHDFTMVTHEQALKHIRKSSSLALLVTRKDL